MEGGKHCCVLEVCSVGHQMIPAAGHTIHLCYVLPHCKALWVLDRSLQLLAAFVASACALGLLVPKRRVMLVVLAA